MNNKIHNALAPIRATEELKQSLTVFVQREASKHRRKSSAPLHYAVACCAVLALILCGVGGYSLYQSPVSYISVDINPSIELGLNRLDRVVSIEAYNDDGLMVLQDLHIKNKTYTDAVELLLADKTFQNYLADDFQLSFTVISDKEETLLEGIRQCRGYPQTNAECHGAKATLMDEAHHSGLSFGKYRKFLELSQYDETITSEACRDLSMREIRDRINQYTGDGGKANSGSTVPDSGKDNHGNGKESHGNEKDNHGNDKGHHGGRAKTPS